MTELICYFQLCLNIANSGMACTDSGKGSPVDYSTFVILHAGKGKVVLGECVKPGEEPSLTFDLPKGLRLRKEK